MIGKKSRKWSWLGVGKQSEEKCRVQIRENGSVQLFNPSFAALLHNFHAGSENGDRTVKWHPKSFVESGTQRLGRSEDFNGPINLGISKISLSVFACMHILLDKVENGAIKWSAQWGNIGALLSPWFRVFGATERSRELLPIICHLDPQPEMESAKIATAAESGNRSPSQFRYLCRAPPSLINCAEICFHCSKKKTKTEETVHHVIGRDEKASLLYTPHPSHAVMFVQLTFMAFNDALFQFSGSKITKELFFSLKKTFQNLKMWECSSIPVVIWQIII